MFSVLQVGLWTFMDAFSLVPLAGADDQMILNGNAQLADHQGSWRLKRIISWLKPFN